MKIIVFVKDRESYFQNVDVTVKNITGRQVQHKEMRRQIVKRARWFQRVNYINHRFNR